MIEIFLPISLAFVGAFHFQRGWIVVSALFGLAALLFLAGGMFR